MTIDVVTLVWTLPWSARGPGTVEALVDILRAHLPEGLPRRFGGYEPLPLKVIDGDYAPVAAEWAREIAAYPGGFMFWSGTAPCFGGFMYGSDPRKDASLGPRVRRCQRIEMQFDGRATAEPFWREAVAGLFTEAAGRLGAVHGIGYVERGWQTRLNKLSIGVGFAGLYPLPRTAHWLGVPAVPAWLTWFGGPYREALRPVFADDEVQEHPTGFTVRLGDAPLPLSELAGRWPALPASLLVSGERPARTIPDLEPAP